MVKRQIKVFGAVIRPVTRPERSDGNTWQPGHGVRSSRKGPHEAFLLALMRGPTQHRPYSAYTWAGQSFRLVDLAAGSILNIVRGPKLPLDFVHASCGEGSS